MNICTYVCLYMSKVYFLQRTQTYIGESPELKCGSTKNCKISHKVKPFLSSTIKFRTEEVSSDSGKYNQKEILLFESTLKLTKLTAHYAPLCVPLSYSATLATCHRMLQRFRPQQFECRFTRFLCHSGVSTDREAQQFCFCFC